MSSKIPWVRTMGAKLGGSFLVMLVLSLLLVASSLFVLAGIRGDAAAINELGLGRALNLQVLLLASELSHATGPERTELVAKLQELIGSKDQRSELFRQGDRSLGVLPVSDERVLAALRNQEQTWQADVRPLLQRLIDASSADAAQEALTQIEQRIPEFGEDLNETVSTFQSLSEEKARRFATTQYLLLAVAVIVLAAVYWLTRDIVRRVRALTSTIGSVGAGDLSLEAQVEGNDEVAVLASEFNGMTRSLRELLSAVAETANGLSAASSELLASTAQQASSAQQQAAAVSETMSTVDEVQQTSEQAAGRATSVAESAQRAAEIGKTGREAVEAAVSAMATVQEQTEAIAENIVALAERAQAIGEIIASVNDVAEQTNLLALNAGIEAARAGDQGAGFTVVAREIKDLAAQSKQATSQVTRILGEIQKATNSAVMVTEDGSKSVNTTIETVNRAGETIRTLATTIDEAATAANQITASAAQQATGMSQVQSAMRDIDRATTQSTAATKQAEQAAQDLNALGGKLKDLLAT